MKKKLLILTQNPVAKIGIASYLSSIFSQYLTIESIQSADLTPEALQKTDLILFSSENVYHNLPYSIPDRIGQLICMRIFNHTYLHKILQIPPGSLVYLVNDTEASALEVVRQLQEYGFSQYQFIPYYPGCPGYQEDIIYGVTPGELHLVPRCVRTVIDIGNRVVDISTINEIIAFFGLPTSLADEITRNYMSHLVQVLKLSNQQLSRSLDSRQISRIIIENVSEGLCLVNQGGQVEFINAAFQKLIGFKDGNKIGESFVQLLKEYGIPYDFPNQNDIIIEKEGMRPLRLWSQKFTLSRNTALYLLHGAPCEEGTSRLLFPPRVLHLCDFSHFVTCHPIQLHLLDTARRVSLNDYHIIIQGESGTEKEMLAQAIHRNSMRHKGPFVSLNFSSLTPSYIEAELLGSRENPAQGLHHRVGALEAAAGGTLLLNGIHHMGLETQQLLLNVLHNGYYMAMGADTLSPLNVRIIATTTTDLYALVLEGRFLDDLFFLLNTVSLNTLPLRQRRGDIPLLLESALKHAFKDPSVTARQVLSENLSSYLKRYDWPGNIKEVNNLCSYFSCLYKREPLQLNDLPGYILNQIRSRETRLELTDKKILSLIAASPRIGRAAIQSRLAEEGISLSEGKIRTILQRLAEGGYIKVHRTRGGCEVTELGALMVNV